MKKKEFILQDILSKIYQQQFHTNKLPDQRNLAKEYGVSRFTIQEVVTTLKEIGVIHAVQGSGMFINDSVIHNPLIFNSMTVTPYERISSKLLYLKKEIANQEDQQIFQLRSTELVWSFQRIRIVNYQIQQIENSRMPVALFPDLDENVIENSIQNYVQKCGYQISHYITTYAPSAISRIESEILSCKKGIPAMKIMNRCLLENGDIYEYSELTAINYSCSYITPFNQELHRTRFKE